MRPVFKIFLWVLATLGVIALGLIGLGVYLGYNFYTENVRDYSCIDYNRTLEDITHEEEKKRAERSADEINAEVKQKMMFGYMGIYLALKHPDLFENKNENPRETIIHAVNELSSLCRTYPQLKGSSLYLPDDKDGTKFKAKLAELLSKVTYQTDPTSTLIGEAVYIDFKNRHELANLISTSTPTQPAAQ